QNQYINSDFINFNLSVFILLLVLFGGSGSLLGPLLGAVTLTILSALLARWSWLEHFVNGALLLVALYAMPKGLAGLVTGWSKRSTTRREPSLAGTTLDGSGASLPVRASATTTKADAPMLSAE